MTRTYFAQDGRDVVPIGLEGSVEQLLSILWRGACQ